MPQLRRLRAALVTSMLACAALLAGPASAVASCVMPPSFDEVLKSAEIVFVGTVTATANGDRWATVSVEEVWRGPNLPASVLVKGGGPDPNAASSVDRTFLAGVRYIFLPHRDEAGGLADSSCSSTQVWDDSLAAFRPADARLGEVEARGDATAIDLAPVLAIGGFVMAVFALMLGVGLLARGRSD